MPIDHLRLDHHIDPTQKSFVVLDQSRHPYIHGGGFGIATEILADIELSSLLKTLEPQRFRKCDRILDTHQRVLNAACSEEITLCMENSAVIAAIAQFKLGITPIEWDVWLDPNEPQSVEKAVVEHGSVFAILLGKVPSMRSYFLKSAPSVTEWVDTYHKAIVSCNCLSKVDGRKIEVMPSICLDIKSVWSTAEDIDCFVRALKDRFQINVSFVGSFSYQQIAQVKESQIILFCHAVWDLKKSVQSGHFSKRLMLNGADLKKKSHLEELIKMIDNHELQVGIYVQEPQADTAAVQSLIRMVNSDPTRFKIGFALGNGRNGLSAKMIKGSGAGVQKILLTDSVLIRMVNSISKIFLFITFLFSLNYRVTPR